MFPCFARKAKFEEEEQSWIFEEDPKHESQKIEVESVTAEVEDQPKQPVHEDYNDPFTWQVQIHSIHFVARNFKCQK